MNEKLIIVRPSSYNFWWGVYGFSEKTGWDDLHLSFQYGDQIGVVCICSRAYLKAGIEEMRNDSGENEYVKAVEKYLDDDSCHYWYNYMEKGDEDFREVSYHAPVNKKGVKPSYVEIWHPDHAIGISTIESAIQAFAELHLGIEACEVKVADDSTFEEISQAFKEDKELYHKDSKLEIKFSDQVLDELSTYWKLPKEEVLKKLENSIKSDLDSIC